MDKRIQLVEDDDDIRFIIEYILEDSDYQVESFPNAKLFEARPHKTDVDLVILDVLLPDGNGIEICHDLKNDMFTKHIPVIVMSANIRSKQMSEMAEPDDYISKPFDLDDIENRIKNLLERKKTA